MKAQRMLGKPAVLATVSAVLMVFASPSFAHCDGVDGPVVKAAQDALDRDDVNRVLIWVQPGDEAEIRRAFDKTKAVRKLNAAAKDLADHAFYETLVRVHRAGEGEPYTGLKPAGRDLGPALPAGDKAIDSRSVEPVVELLTRAVHDGVEQRYRDVMARKTFKTDDVAGGRKYVQAYVEYIHSVEKIHAVAAGDGDAHEARAAEPAHRH